MSKPLGSRFVDMSLPPEKRGRKRRQKVIGGTPPAQMGHATGGSSRHWRREGQRRMDAEWERRQAAAAGQEPELELAVQDGPGTAESVLALAHDMLHGGGEDPGVPVHG